MSLWALIKSGEFLSTYQELHSFVIGFRNGLSLVRGFKDEDNDGRPDNEDVRAEPHYYDGGEIAGTLVRKALGDDNAETVADISAGVSSSEVDVDAVLEPVDGDVAKSEPVTHAYGKAAGYSIGSFIREAAFTALGALLSGGGLAYIFGLLGGT